MEFPLGGCVVSNCFNILPGSSFPRELNESIMILSLRYSNDDHDNDDDFFFSVKNSLIFIELC
jgi:hypothetical protein